MVLLNIIVCREKEQSLVQLHYEEVSNAAPNLYPSGPGALFGFKTRRKGVV